MSEFEESEELADEPTILPMDLDLGPDQSQSTAPRNHAKVLEPDMAEIWPLIRQVLTDHRGQSLTVKALARRLNFDSIQSITLRRAVKKLLKSGRWFPRIRFLAKPISCNVV